MARSFCKTWWGNAWLQALAEMAVSTGENWIGKLSNRELKEIFG